MRLGAAKALILVLLTGSAPANTVTIKPVQDIGLEGTASYIRYTDDWGSFYTGHFHGTPNDAGLDYIYLKYDLSVLTPPAHYAVTIDSVTFFGTTTNRTGTAAYQDGLYAVEDTTWTEDNITWSNKPALGNLLVAWDFPCDWTQFTATSSVLINYVDSKFATPNKLAAFSVFGINPPANSDAHGYNDVVNIYSPDFAMQLTITYTLVPETTVQTPVISPGGGSSWTSRPAAIFCGTPGAVIHYTRDGTDPDNTSAVYTGPFPAGPNETIKARAFADGYDPSAVATAVFSYPTTVDTPAISPNGGSGSASQTVTITCNTPGATIRYTLTGTDPDNTSTAYAGSFIVSGAQTVKAKAFASGYDPSAVATAVFFPDNQAPEIDPTKAPVVVPFEGSVITPISHQPYFLGERELFGYHPRFIPNTVTFDENNRPYMCVGMYANGHDLYSDDNISLGVVQTLDDAGNWIQLNTFIPAIKAQYPSWDGMFSASVGLDQRIAFDSSGDAYMLVQTYSHLGFNLLLHSKDKCQSWRAYPLPTACYFLKLEVPEAWNDTNNPPAILGYPYGYPGSYGYTGGPIYLILPVKNGDGTLTIPAKKTITSDPYAYPQPNQSGMGNSTITKGNLVHVVFMRCTSYPGFTGTPQYVATYNRATGEVTSPVFLGCSDTDNPQLHDGPCITIDSKGYLHAILGCLAQRFKYTKSLVPNSSTSGWTEPVNIGRPKDATGGGWTYVSLVCDKNDTLHVVGQYAGYYYCYGIWYIRKTATGPWEDLGPLFMPFRSGYSNWYQRLTMDGRGRLFVNYIYYGDQYHSYEIDAYKAKWPWENPVLQDPVNLFYFPTVSGHDPAMIMSDDGGNHWRLALTSSFQGFFSGNTFENGLDGWILNNDNATASLQTVASYSYAGKTISPRSGATFICSDASPYYKKATRNISPAQYGTATGYLNMVENVNTGMIEVATTTDVLVIIANYPAGKVSYMIQNQVTPTDVPVTPQTWHQVKFVSSATGLDGYWDGQLLFHTSITEKITHVAFGSTWSSGPCGFDDFSFTPISTVQGQVNLLNFTGTMAGLPVTFELRSPGQTTPLEIDNATLDAAGHYSFATALAGTYDLTAKASHWLRQKQADVVLAAGATVNANFVLTNGDCDGNNTIDEADLFLVVGAMDAVGNGMVDLDGDGEITSTDLAIVLASMDGSGN